MLTAAPIDPGIVAVRRARPAVGVERVGHREARHGADDIPAPATTAHATLAARTRLPADARSSVLPVRSWATPSSSPNADLRCEPVSSHRSSK